MEYDLEQLSRQAKILLDRLERLSADSRWAHRASGIRGSLIRSMTNLKDGNIDPTKIAELIKKGSVILIYAAREIPDQNSF